MASPRTTRSRDFVANGAISAVGVRTAEVQISGLPFGPGYVSLSPEQAKELHRQLGAILYNDVDGFSLADVGGYNG